MNDGSKIINNIFDNKNFNEIANKNIHNINDKNLNPEELTNIIQ